MTTTWYRVSTWGKPKITTVEVTKETDKYITYLQPSWDNKRMDERRSSKSNEFWPTFAAARQELLVRYKRDMNQAQIEYEEAKERFHKVYLMEKPE